MTDKQRLEDLRIVLEEATRCFTDEGLSKDQFEEIKKLVEDSVNLIKKKKEVKELQDSFKEMSGKDPYLMVKKMFVSEN